MSVPPKLTHFINSFKEGGTITRNVSHFKLMKCVKEESDYEDQSIETNHVGNELKMEEHETTPRRSKRDQRPVKRYGITCPQNLYHKKNLVKLTLCFII